MAVAKSSNPYTPDWGVEPPLLTGRDDHLARAEEALATGPRHPWFTHGYYGDRGVGKTVLLDAIGRSAAARRWPVVHTAVRAGAVLDALVEAQLPAALKTLSRRAARRVVPAETETQAVIGGAVGRAQVTRRRPVVRPGVAMQLEQLLFSLGEAAARRGVGVLLTVDEVHAADTSELEVLSQTVQLVTKRRQLPVALVVAGLAHTPAVLTGPGMTFLERMAKAELGFLGPDATRLALDKPAHDLGVAFSEKALTVLVRASGGYPYLVQLLGYHAWEAAGGASIDEEASRAALVRAEGAIVTNAFAPRWARLAPKEQAFLVAMAAHGNRAPMRSVVASLGASRYEEVSYLRGRLLAKGAIRSDGRGWVAFVLPGMDRWVLQQRR